MSRGSVTNFDWRTPIQEVSLKQMYPELGNFKEFSEKKVITTESKDRLFAVVGEKKVVWPHYTLIDTIDPVIKKEVGKFKADIHSYTRDGRMLAIYDLLDIPPVYEGKKLETKLRLLIYNSYSGSWPLKILLGAFTLVCSNGATIGKQFGSIGTKDIGGDMNMLRKKIAQLVDNGKHLETVWKSWTQVKLEMEEAMLMLDKIFPPKYLELTLNKIEKYPTNKWELYNACTNTSTHNITSELRKFDTDRALANLFYENEEELPMPKALKRNEHN